MYTYLWLIKKFLDYYYGILNLLAEDVTPIADKHNFFNTGDNIISTLPVLLKFFLLIML